MFERITINRQGFNGEPIDLGFLAECLVFYEKVRVISDVEIFRFLVRCCGPDELLELLTMGALEIEFFENNSGVQTVETNIGPLHELMAFTSHSTRYLQVSRKLFDELSGPSGRGASKLFSRFQRFVQRSTYTKEELAVARTDWIDRAYTASAAKSLLSLLAPEYLAPEPLIFEVDAVPGAAHTGGTFKVVTNIDFEAANLSYHRHIAKEHSSLSSAYLLVHIANARRDLTVGSREQSEFAVAPATGLVAACKFSEIITTANPGFNASDVFQETVVDDLPKIREVVNSGDKTFQDVVQLVQRGAKFKDWLKKHRSEDLRVAYCREVSQIDWADKLPSKPVRWLLVNIGTTALGTIAGHPMAGAAAANALSAADYFLLDKMLKGWKPNQFVEGPLKQFLRTG